MAGESPDKVEREESSGETAAEGGTVASTGKETPGRTAKKTAGKTAGKAAGKGAGKSAKKNGTAVPPRVESTSDPEPTGVDAQGGDASGSPAGGGGDSQAEGGSEGGSKGGDRLKDAVAAWVAGPEDEGPQESGSENAASEDRKPLGTEPSAEESKTGQSAASELPVRPKPSSEERAGTGAAGGGAVGKAGKSGKPGSGTAGARTGGTGPAGEAEAAGKTGEDDPESAARRSSRATAAFFGAGKRKSGTDADPAAEGTSGETSGETSGGSAAAAPDATGSAAGGTGSAGGDDTGSDAPAGDVVDQPTAVFRAPGAKKASKSGLEDGNGDGDGGEAGREHAEGGQGGGSTDEGSAGDAGSAGGAGPAGDVVDQPTAVFRAPASRKGAKGPKAAKGAKDAEDANGSDDGKGAKDDKGPAAEKDEGTESGGEPSRNASTSARTAPVDPRATTGDGDAEPSGKAGDRERKTGEAPDSGSGPGARTGSGSGSESATGFKTGAAAGTSAAVTTGAAAATGASTGTGTGTGTGTEAAPEAGTKTGTGIKAVPGTGDGTGSGQAADSGAESESESERTSQFVPLRSADAPPRPPKPPVPAVPPKPLGKPRGKSEGVSGETAEQPQPQPLTEAELTRQQPRPDQQPLDLLAQLTNKPPKPETPLRTVGRRVKIWTPLVLVLVVLFAIAQAVRPLPDPQLKLTAAPTYTFKGAKPSVPWPSEGQAVLDVDGLGSLGSSGKDKPVPVASVAKMMTAYLVLRDHPVKKGTKGAVIPVDKKAEDEAGLSAQNESTVKVKQGDKITEREAIQATMIASANNVARLLARWDAGSEKAFTKKMNAAAKQLGMHDTKYTDPSGLTSSTVSTAGDQVKLAKKAMDNGVFKSVVRMPGYSDSEGKKHPNWNKLVPLDGVVGIKTGTTTKAGGNLIFAAEKNVAGTKQLIVGAVLGQYKPSILDTVLGASKKLIDTAQDSLRAQKVVHKGDVVGYMDDQLGGRTPVVATKDVTAVGWSGLKVKLGLTGGGKAPRHTGSPDDKVGTLTVGHGPGQVRVPVALKKKMPEPGFGAKLTRIL